MPGPLLGPGVLGRLLPEGRSLSSLRWGCWASSPRHESSSPGFGASSAGYKTYCTLIFSTHKDIKAQRDAKVLTSATWWTQLLTPNSGLVKAPVLGRAARAAAQDAGRGWSPAHRPLGRTHMPAQLLSFLPNSPLHLWT